MSGLSGIYDIHRDWIPHILISSYLGQYSRESTKLFSEQSCSSQMHKVPFLISHFHDMSTQANSQTMLMTVPNAHSCT